MSTNLRTECTCPLRSVITDTHFFVPTLQFCRLAKGEEEPETLPRQKSSWKSVAPTSVWLRAQGTRTWSGHRIPRSMRSVASICVASWWPPASSPSLWTPCPGEIKSSQHLFVAGNVNHAGLYWVLSPCIIRLTLHVISLLLSKCS
jgi:hypothetical protein